MSELNLIRGMQEALAAIEKRYQLESLKNEEAILRIMQGAASQAVKTVRGIVLPSDTRVLRKLLLELREAGFEAIAQDRNSASWHLSPDGCLVVSIQVGSPAEPCVGDDPQER